MRRNLILVWCLLVPAYISAQPKEPMVRAVAFYNAENLFDTINDPHKSDNDRTPNGADRWTSKVYNDHIQKIAKVLSETGINVTHHAPNIIGIAEIGSDVVLTDPINTPYLKKYNYGIIHYESPDARGVDVALLYKQGIFKPSSSRAHPLYLIKENGKPLYTRNQLLVSGDLDGEEVHSIINHWPSCLGEEAGGRPVREKAAALDKQIIDSLLKINPNAKMMSMGDFNGDPINSGFKNIFKTKDKKEGARLGELFNSMEAMLEKGIRTLAYQDSWNFFDQIYFTYDLLKEDKSSYRYWKVGIFNRPYLANPKGRYKGYPFRSMANGNYTWGYSDHFPAYIYLIRKIKNK